MYIYIVCVRMYVCIVFHRNFQHVDGTTLLETWLHCLHAILHHRLRDFTDKKVVEKRCVSDFDQLNIVNNITRGTCCIDFSAVILDELSIHWTNTIGYRFYRIHGKMEFKSETLENDRVLWNYTRRNVKYCENIENISFSGEFFPSLAIW